MPRPNLRLKSAVTLGLLFAWASLTAFAHEVIGYLPDYRVTPQTLSTLPACTDVRSSVSVSPFTVAIGKTGMRPRATPIS